MALDLSDREQRAIELAIQYCENDRSDAILTFGGQDGLQQTAAEPTSQHEVLDRTYMIRDNWETFVIEHPVVLVNPEAHRLAQLAAAMMQEVYQLIGGEELDV